MKALLRIGGRAAAVGPDDHPDAIAQEIVEDLEAALAEFAAVAQSARSPREPPAS